MDNADNKDAYYITIKGSHFTSVQEKQAKENIQKNTNLIRNNTNEKNKLLCHFCVCSNLMVASKQPLHEPHYLHIKNGQR